MQGIIDLHVHSTASDGTLTPSEVAKKAKESGLCAVALTDHDTVSGVEEFLTACEREGICGIAGMELSASFEGEMHIVGLFVDYKNEEFLNKLYKLEHAREIRNEKMLEKCNELGFSITKEDLLSQKDNADMDNIGRPHFAKAFVNKGYAQDINEAFDKYFAKNKLCYAKRELYSPGDTISIIHSGGGLAILAHPNTVSTDKDKLKEIVSELKKCGLDGMECRHSDMDDEFSKMCEGLCEKLGLFKSGGSDFHGSNKSDTKLGTGKGNLRVPEEYIAKMHERF